MGLFGGGLFAGGLFTGGLFGEGTTETVVAVVSGGGYDLRLAMQHADDEIILAVIKTFLEVV